MRNNELDAALMSRTPSEVIDLLETLLLESQRIGQAADILLRYLRTTEPTGRTIATARLLEAIRDTADHCCRVIEGPR